MHSWSAPHVPQFPSHISGGSDTVELPALPALSLYDTADDVIKPVAVPADGSPVGMLSLIHI